MTTSTVFSFADGTADQQIWANLKDAIASSSGFQRWQLEKSLATPLPIANEQGCLNQINQLDQQVRSYLRETLETLAY
jgi:hypothetical protein